MRGHQIGQVPRILRAKSILESGATTTHSQAAVTTCGISVTNFGVQRGQSLRGDEQWVARNLWFYAQRQPILILRASHLVTEPLQCRSMSSLADLPEEKYCAKFSARKNSVPCFWFEMIKKVCKIAEKDLQQISRKIMWNLCHAVSILLRLCFRYCPESAKYKEQRNWIPALCSTKYFTISKCPSKQAALKGVELVFVVEFTFAPLFTSSRTISKWPAIIFRRIDMIVTTMTRRISRWVEFIVPQRWIWPAAAAHHSGGAPSIVSPSKVTLPAWDNILNNRQYLE